MKLKSFIRRFTKLQASDYLPKLSKDVHTKLEHLGYEPLIERVMAWGIHPDASAAKQWLDEHEITSLEQLERHKPVKPRADWRGRVYRWLLDLEGAYPYDPHASELEAIRKGRIR